METIPFSFPEPVIQALKALNDAGFSAYAVGGCVRDFLLDRIPGDYDICTSALPEETERIFSGFRLIETGLKHGTVTVLIDGMPLEITTYRIESEYTDHRRPDSVVFTDRLTDDLSRRDFTVNAMAMDRFGTVTDCFRGRDDLAGKRIRCVGDPITRFREDALRMLRALRFSAVLGFSIEQQTAAAIRSEIELIQAVSAERIFTELKKLLCGQYAEQVLLEFSDVVTKILPELKPMIGFDQQNPHHCHDVWIHSVKALSCVPAVPEDRFAAFLHDCGKPDTFTCDAAGIGHFYGHAQRSVELADMLLSRLRADNRLKNTVLTRIAAHDTPVEPKEKAVRRALAKYGEPEFFAILKLQRADNLAQSPEYRRRQADYDALEVMAREILTRPGCFSLKDLAINGKDLLAAGFPEGPEIGAVLNTLLQQVLDGSIENERAALLKAASSHCLERSCP